MSDCRRAICRCNCGYKCGGPGRCELWSKPGLDGMQECIDQHFKRDCGHKFGGEMVELGSGCSSVLCTKCGLSAMSHDEACGP